MEYKLSEDVATAEIDELLDHYQIDAADVEQVRAKLIRFCRLGLVENVKDGAEFKVRQNFLYPPGEVKAVTYAEVHGKHKIAMDEHKATAAYTRIYSLMASLSGLPIDAFKDLKSVDISVVECLGAVFIAG
jgi:hypothetical protein